MSYKVINLRGDYYERQEAANQHDAALYVEWHFNGVDNPRPNYSVTVVGLNASETSKRVGRAIAERVAEAFGIKTGGDRGLFIGGTGADPARGIAGRGNGNLSRTRMPAVLLEPWFITNPEGARWASDPKSRTKLGTIVAEVIRDHFAPGSLIAFSLGHKYRTSKPNDRGVMGYHGIQEAELAEAIMQECQEILEGKPVAVTEPDHSVDVNNMAEVVQPEKPRHIRPILVRPLETLSVEEWETTSRVGFRWGKPRRN